ncbi:MAG: hypothetical protein ABSH53_18695 [Holophaga sp.]
MPPLATLMAQGVANGFDDDGAADAMATLGGNATKVSRTYATDDGTAFLVHLWYEARVGEDIRRAGGRFLFLQGPNAVWGRKENPTVAYFTNRYGDRVSVADSTHDLASSTPTVVITNERYPAHTITARLVLGGQEACPSAEPRVQARLGRHAILKTSNTLGLPAAELEGRFRPQGGFLPERFTETAEGESRTFIFDWLKSPDGTLDGRLEQVTHPNGVVETLTYGFLRDGEHDWPMVETVSTRDASGAGNSVKISRNRAVFSMFEEYGEWGDQPSTRIAHYSDPIPGTGPCRVVVLTHPPTTWGWGIDLHGYLFYTNAVLQQDCYAAADESNLGEPFETRLYDGWSLRSWKNRRMDHCRPGLSPRLSFAGS